MSRTLGYLLCAATLALVVLALILCPPAAGESSPSPSPSPVASPTPTPASDSLVAWARHWRRAAARARSRTARACRCLGIDAPARLAPAPARSADSATWTAAGRRWKHAVPRYRARTERLVRRMTHPGGSGAGRWLPLARWIGWPRSELDRLRLCIRLESGGDPGASNGVCDGLLQIHRCHGVANVFSPVANLRAGLRLWRANRRAGGSGWGDWTTMRRYW